MAELKDQLVTLEVLKYSKDTLDNKINILVYDLYGLSKNEISKIEEFCKTI